jgi:hypothetical protein
MWSWANKHTPDKVNESTNRIKEFGEKCGYAKLTKAILKVTSSTHGSLLQLPPI